MPVPYWQELRERVIGFMALGGSVRAAVRFDVNVSSGNYILDKGIRQG